MSRLFQISIDVRGADKDRYVSDLVAAFTALNSGYDCSTPPWFYKSVPYTVMKSVMDTEICDTIDAVDRTGIDSVSFNCKCDEVIW